MFPISKNPTFGVESTSGLDVYFRQRWGFIVCLHYRSPDDKQILRLAFPLMFCLGEFNPFHLRLRCDEFVQSAVSQAPPPPLFIRGGLFYTACSVQGGNQINTNNYLRLNKQLNEQTVATSCVGARFSWAVGEPVGATLLSRTWNRLTYLCFSCAHVYTDAYTATQYHW